LGFTAFTKTLHLVYKTILVFGRLSCTSNISRLPQATIGMPFGPVLVTALLLQAANAGAAPISKATNEMENRLISLPLAAAVGLLVEPVSQKRRTVPGAVSDVRLLAPDLRNFNRPALTRLFERRAELLHLLDQFHGSPGSENEPGANVPRTGGGLSGAQLSVTRNPKIQAQRLSVKEHREQCICKDFLKFRTVNDVALRSSEVHLSGLCHTGAPMVIERSAQM
jgi:hypothetical protein